MADPVISQMFGTRPPKPWTNAKVVALENPSPHLLYGVELEIENCNEDWTTAGFKVVTDGSLRNNGFEFVSSPMTYSNMAYALETFFNRNKPVEIKDDHHDTTDASNYSDRTSIHVHTNVTDLTFKQLMGLCLIYEVFEKLLFTYIGNDRDKNIFCVPWSETTLTYSALPELIGVNGVGVIKNWQKYTALNLIPVGTQGSIEWRHMHGNADLQFILTWLRLIGHIYKYIQNTDIEEIKSNFLGMNTTSAYDHLLDRVFSYDADKLRTNNYRFMLEEGVLEMKYAMLEKPNTKKSSGGFGSVMWRNEAADLITQARIQEIQLEMVDNAAWAIARPALRTAPAVRVNTRGADPAAPVIIFDELNEDNR